MCAKDGKVFVAFWDMQRSAAVLLGRFSLAFKCKLALPSAKLLDVPAYLCEDRDTSAIRIGRTRYLEVSVSWSTVHSTSMPMSLRSSRKPSASISPAVKRSSVSAMSLHFWYMYQILCIFPGRVQSAEQSAKGIVANLKRLNMQSDG